MLSVVAPIYNEVDSVAELHRRLTSVLEGLGEYEIVLVDDGSSDGSWQALIDLAAGDRHLRLVKLSRNFGHQAALSAGLDAARGDAVVLMDGDLQDPPEVIPELVAQWRDGSDVVYAVRSARQGDSRSKRVLASVFYRALRRMTSTDIPADAGDFRLLSRRAADTVAALPERARYLRGLTSWIGFRQTSVAYVRQPRRDGESKYPVRRSLRLAVDAVTSFSTFPIKVMTMLGLLLVMFCLGVLGWTLYVKYSTHDATPGWTSVIAVVLLLGGVQLVSLGVLGQYIARIFEEAKQRPVYLVDEVVGGDSDPAT
jgi:polyisoprenyl-phosphate glycosyltransferase